MSDESPIFERIADELERRSSWTRLETRGTLRLALKEAGLFPRTVTARPMIVVLERILPTMLARRGIKDPSELCRALSEFLTAQPGTETPDEDAPDSIFSRLGGSRAPISSRGPISSKPSIPPAPPSSRNTQRPPSRSSPSIAPGTGPDSRPGSKP